MFSQASVILSMGGVMRGGGACMVVGGTCGMGACLAWECAWQGGMHGIRDSY